MTSGLVEGWWKKTFDEDASMLRFTYPVKLTRDRKDGGYVVTCRDLPEAITQGDSLKAALAEAKGALQAAIEGPD